MISENNNNNTDLNTRLEMVIKKSKAQKEVLKKILTQLNKQKSEFENHTKKLNEN